MKRRICSERGEMKRKSKFELISLLFSCLSSFPWLFVFSQFECGSAVSKTVQSKTVIRHKHLHASVQKGKISDLLERGGGQLCCSFMCMDAIIWWKANFSHLNLKYSSFYPGASSWKVCIMKTYTSWLYYQLFMTVWQSFKRQSHSDNCLFQYLWFTTSSLFFSSFFLWKSLSTFLNPQRVKVQRIDSEEFLLWKRLIHHR